MTRWGFNCAIASDSGSRTSGVQSRLHSGWWNWPLTLNLHGHTWMGRVWQCMLKISSKKERVGTSHRVVPLFEVTAELTRVWWGQQKRAANYCYEKSGPGQQFSAPSCCCCQRANLGFRNLLFDRPNHCALLNMSAAGSNRNTSLTQIYV